MSDDRYEIRSKIGQGGVGAVYRAFDRHLNREVAIKRVLPEGGYENQEEATKAMLNEAASLCSVQHPNIVTVFDAGVDNDGPYVVMELLSGRTIDEMIDRGTLTIQDFREVALQSQEALIAAQDLDLVHRDIKPTNVMVTWLPSGRFQVKLVDFGLAKFSPKPSLQTIDHGDSVFGSIHFMAPEQFERTPLDKRTDMYSMGCVYYYCLAGVYPFDGETAPQVMNAHLQHQIKPLQDHRPDLPPWLCQWVMWHLARQMEERPRDAREALKLFLMSENSPENSTSQIPLVSNPALNAAPQMNVPAAGPIISPTGPVVPHVTGPVNTATAPQPILPPEGKAPSIHTEAQTVKAPVIPTPVEPMGPAPDMPNDRKPSGAPAQATMTPQAAAASPAAAAGPKLIIPNSPVQAPAPEPETTPAPSPSQPLVTASAPPQASAPASPDTPQMSEPLSVPASGDSPKFNIPDSAAQTDSQDSQQTQAPASSGPLINVKGPQLDKEKAPPQPAANPAPTGDSAAQAPAGTDALQSPLVSIPVQKGMSGATKGVIAALLLVAIIIAGFVLVGRKAEQAKQARLAEITAPFKAGPENYPSEIELTKSDVTLLLDTIITPDATEKGTRNAYLQALNIGKTSDNSDLDDMVAKYATRTQMSEDARINLFKVLKLRSNPSALAPLINFARSTDQPKSGQAAIEATEKMATADDFGQLLSIVTLAQDGEVRRAAVRTLKTVIKKTSNKSPFSAPIVSSFRSSSDSEAREGLLQLLGAAGGDRAAELIETHLNGTDIKLQLAAIAGLREWPDNTQFETLYTFVDNEDEGTLRKQGFLAMLHFLTEGPELNEDDLSLFWSDTATLALSESEQSRVVTAMISQKGEWPLRILDHFMKRGLTDRVKGRAEDGKAILEKRLASEINVVPEEEKPVEEEPEVDNENDAPPNGNSE